MVVKLAERDLINGRYQKVAILKRGGGGGGRREPIQWISKVLFVDFDSVFSVDLFICKNDLLLDNGS